MLVAGTDVDEIDVAPVSLLLVGLLLPIGIHLYSAREPGPVGAATEEKRALKYSWSAAAGKLPEPSFHTALNPSLTTLPSVVNSIFIVPVYVVITASSAGTKVP